MNLFRFVLLGVFLTLSSTTTLAFTKTTAADCGTLDFRKDFPMKIRNQGEINWCYAHAAADYLQFYFRVPTQISAADVAVEYNQNLFPRILNWFRKSSTPEFGLIKVAMQNALDLGYCPEVDFPSEVWKKQNFANHKPTTIETKELMASIDDLMNLWDMVDKNLVKSADDLPFTFLFPHVTKDQLFEILYNSRQVNVLTSLRDAACDADRRPYPRQPNDVVMVTANDDIFAGINQELNIGKPVTIDYFYGVLENLDHFPYKLSDLHTSGVYGRRFDESNQQCQYLVKNSFGPNCDHYDPRIECQAGYLWVNESSLSTAILSYEYFN